MNYFAPNEKREWPPVKPPPPAPPPPQPPAKSTDQAEVADLLQTTLAIPVEAESGIESRMRVKRSAEICQPY